MSLEARYLSQSEVTSHLSSGAAGGVGADLQGWLSWGQTGLGKQGVVRNEKEEVCFHLNTKEFRLLS